MVPQDQTQIRPCGVIWTHYNNTISHGYKIDNNVVVEQTMFRVLWLKGYKYSSKHQPNVMGWME